MIEEQLSAAQRGDIQDVSSSSACAPTSAQTQAGAASIAEGGNQTTTGSPIQLIERACIAAQNNDAQGVITNLELALSALEQQLEQQT